MLKAIDAGRSGLRAAQVRLDLTANNVANVNTPGYKKQEVTFADLLYEEMNAAGRPVTGGKDAAHPLHGAGVKAAGFFRDFAAGPLIQTGRALDVAIEGAGFFRVELPGGGYAYTRSGFLSADPEGRLVDGNGLPVSPGITLPEGFRNVSVGPDGTVAAESESGEITGAGQISLFRFSNPGGLAASGRNLYVSTPASGEPQEGQPGTEGFGSLRAGYLEGSNVDLAGEMAALIEAQRGFQIAARVVKNGDATWEIANNLRK